MTSMVVGDVLQMAALVRSDHLNSFSFNDAIQYLKKDPNPSGNGDKESRRQGPDISLPAIGILPRGSTAITSRHESKEVDVQAVNALIAGGRWRTTTRWPSFLDRRAVGRIVCCARVMRGRGSTVGDGLILLSSIPSFLARHAST